MHVYSKTWGQAGRSSVVCSSSSNSQHYLNLPFSRQQFERAGFDRSASHNIRRGHGKGRGFSILCVFFSGLLCWNQCWLKLLVMVYLTCLDVGPPGHHEWAQWRVLCCRVQRDTEPKHISICSDRCERQTPRGQSTVKTSDEWWLLNFDVLNFCSLQFLCSIVQQNCSGVEDQQRADRADGTKVPRDCWPLRPDGPENAAAQALSDDRGGEPVDTQWGSGQMAVRSCAESLGHISLFAHKTFCLPTMFFVLSYEVGGKSGNLWI